MLRPELFPEAAEDMLLPRPRLIDLIRQPAPAGVTLITAPAGYGKSTLAAQWSRDASGDVVWMWIGPEHNDTGRFLHDIAGLVPSTTGDEGSVPDRGISPQDVLDRLATRPDSQAPLTIVLDNLNRVESEEVLRAITGLMTARLPGVRWMVLTRIVPRLRLARMRAEGRVREIGMDDLAFTPSEITALAPMLTSRQLPQKQAEALATQTGGWIAGIRLTLMAARNAPPRPDDEWLSGVDARAWIEPYIVEEVISALPTDARDFVMRTSTLPYLAPEFVCEVTGIDKGEHMLSLLEQRYIVCRRMTDSGPIMEYAPWIARSLVRIAKQQLSRADRALIRERAASYLLEHDQADVALDAARASGDLSLQTRIVRTLHTPLALEDRTVKILKLLDTLPDVVIRQQPDLAYSYAHSLYHRGDSTTLTDLVSTLLPGWRDSPDATVRGYSQNCKAFVLHRGGDTAGALRHFAGALEHFPPTQYRERLHALAGMFTCASDLGDDDTAHRALDEAATCKAFLPHHQVTWWMDLQTRLANHHALRGNLSLAHHLLDHGLRNVPSTFRGHLPYFDYQIAALRFEANDLAGAEGLIASSFADAEGPSHDNWHADAFALGARIARANGDRDLAAARLDEAKWRAMQFGNWHDLMQVETIQASWDIEDGHLVAARAWENYWHPHNRRWIQSFGQLNAIATLMQLRVAEGRFADAIGLCDQALVEGSTRKRRVETISIMMGGVLAHHFAGQDDKATNMLRRALRERRDDSIARAFATPGHDPGSLLEHVVAQLDPGDAAKLKGLPGFDATPCGELGSLTPRELEVVRLLADGFANKEIGQQMFISERTVKKHVSNLLRKLDVPNRTAIALRARERGWLDD